MQLETIARIETIVRQGWCNERDEFESWLDVDQGQALRLIEMIPNRLPTHHQKMPKAVPDA